MPRHKDPVSMVTGDVLRFDSSESRPILERLLWKLFRSYRMRLLRLVLDWD